MSGANASPIGRSHQKKSAAKGSPALEWSVVTLLALGLFLPFLAIQYDTNGITEAAALEAGALVHKNHMLYRPFGWAVFHLLQAAGYAGSSLLVLQTLNAIFGAAGVGFSYVVFKTLINDVAAATAGTFWLATSFSYWCFSTDAGYIMLAACFAAAAMAVLVRVRSAFGVVVSGVLTSLSILTWQASIFLIPAFLLGLMRNADIRHYSPPQLRRGGAERRGGVGQENDFLEQTTPPLRGSPSLAMEGSFASRLIVFLVTVLFLVGLAYVTLAAYSQGFLTPRQLFAWISTYGEGGNSLRIWGTWNTGRIQSASLSALRSITPVLLAANLTNLAKPVQLGRIAVDLALIALAAILLLSIISLNSKRAALHLRSNALWFLLGYLLFVPFIVWWDPFEPKWFLIPNIFLSGFLACGLASWLHQTFSQIVIGGLVMGMAATNFVTTIRPRHYDLGPDRRTAQCVADHMTPEDLFIAAEWGWPEYLGYLHGRASINLINEFAAEGSKDGALSKVEGLIITTQKNGANAYIADPAAYSERHLRWLREQTTLNVQDLNAFTGSGSFICDGTIIRHVRLWKTTSNAQ